jgi:hypothetical protein
MNILTKKANYGTIKLKDIMKVNTKLIQILVNGHQVEGQVAHTLKDDKITLTYHVDTEDKLGCDLLRDPLGHTYTVTDTQGILMWGKCKLVGRTTHAPCEPDILKATVTFKRV